LKATLAGLRVIENESVFKQATYSYLANAVMSKDEKKRLLKIFEAMDIDKSGTLSLEELTIGYN